MSRAVLAVVLAVCFVFAFGPTGVFAADKTAASPKAAAPAPVPPAASFSMVAGTIEKLDNSDPANIKVEVKNDADGAMRTVSVTPYTSVTKTTDVSELKVGDNVRMMTRKADDKEVAMGIMFGKIKPITAPQPPVMPQGIKPPVPAKK